MFRYCIKLYSGRIFRTISNNESKLIKEDKYIQVLGFITRKSIIFGEQGHSFYDLPRLPDLSELKGTKLVLIDSRGMIKRMSSKVKEVWKEKL